MKKHGRHGTPEYWVWQNMIGRCSSGRHRHNSARYSGRGIVVCDQWRHSFGAFLADVGLRPSPEHSIDRIDNDGNYEPGNVRWSTRQEQVQNSTTVRHFITAFGRTQNVSAWAREVGLKPGTLLRRLAMGVPPEVALSTPCHSRALRAPDAPWRQVQP